MKIIGVLTLTIIAIAMSRCKTEQIILHGEISGKVTDASTTVPLQTATVKLINTNDTTNTGNDGTYLLKSITPGEYEIQVSKSNYGSSRQTTTVTMAKTREINFSLNPLPKISVTYLDFGLDLTSLSFTISNQGTKNFSYSIGPSQNWIIVNPSSGVITDNTDIITVTIDRAGLSENIYIETIKIISDVGTDTKNIYVNGVIDRDLNYYSVARIGTQTWMSKNLNVGQLIDPDIIPTDNGIIEKYCYGSIGKNLNIYGGLYRWDEMMQYNPSDSGLTGTTQGICPDGWHLPTIKEWRTLFDYLGGEEVAGRKLKESGTEHWCAPNNGTNESGFGARAGGRYDSDCQCFWWMCFYSYFWSSTGWVFSDHPDDIFFAAEVDLKNANTPEAAKYESYAEINVASKKNGYAVRCVKNPGKR